MMKRKDREITDPERINQILADCHCCRLGFHDNGNVYIVPLSFGLAEENGNRIFYFHSAKEGRKIDLIQSSPSVGFELDTGYQLHEAEIACGYSARFQSVIGTGTVSLVEHKEDKLFALSKIMQHITEKTDWQFSEDMLDAVCVFRLSVDTLSAKEHL